MQSISALQVIATILTLQFCFNVIMYLAAAKTINSIIERMNKLHAVENENDVEQDIEIFDDGYITALSDYLNLRFKQHLTTPETFENDAKHFTRYILSVFNAMPKVNQMGFFTINSFAKTIVFESHKEEHAL